MDRFRRHKVRTALAVLVLVLAAVAVWTVLSIDQPGPASVADAVDRFNQDGGDGAPSVAVRPPPGVYRYEGEGREELSFPPLHQDDGTELPGTVILRPDGCWRFRIDYNAAHWQEWRYCAAPEGVVVEVGGRTGQRWDLGASEVGNISAFTCDPPNPVLGPELADGPVTQRCTGTNSAVDGRTTSEGPWRRLGHEHRTIGGEEVDTIHFHGERQLSGAQEGTESTDVWFREDGLMVRYERDIEVRTGSPVGDITYTESGWFELADLAPIE